MTERNKINLAEKCPQCSWPYPKLFHLCHDRSNKNATRPPNMLEPKKSSRKGIPSPRKGLPGTQAQKDAAQARWGKERVKNAQRNKQIVDLYNDGVGMVQIAERVGISKSTVNKILQRADALGLTELRPQGRNYRFDQAEV